MVTHELSVIAPLRTSRSIVGSNAACSLPSWRWISGHSGSDPLYGRRSNQLVLFCLFDLASVDPGGPLLSVWTRMWGLTYVEKPL